MRITRWSAAASVLLIAACGSPQPKVPEQQKATAPDVSNI
jgi:hypothetical protein